MELVFDNSPDGLRRPRRDILNFRDDITNARNTTRQLRAMLCAACTIAFTGIDRPWYYTYDRGQSIPAYAHHAAPAGLVKAAKEGCHICSIIWRKLSGDEQAVLLNTWSNPYLYRISQGLLRLWTLPQAFYSWSPLWFSKDDFGICFQFGDPIWHKTVFRIMPVTEQCPEGEDDVDHEMVSPVTPESATRARDWSRHQHLHTCSMWTPRIRRLVERWYAACTESHESCRAGYHDHDRSVGREHSFQPTRILDLQGGKVRLDCNPGDRKDQRYASLTHRWSIKPESMPRLNASNLKQWEEIIDEDILTRTFKDAIAVARRMQIRYIWIDSLCILQHGPGWAQDWQYEAARMGEVYRHAFLNIQAGRDTDAGPYGLFKTPSHRDIEPFRVNINRDIVRPKKRAGASDQPPAHVQGSFFIVEEDFARDELIGNPINRRGWVLQERLLSHRIVHFGPDQVFWECRQLLACETFPEGLPKTIPQTLARAATQLARSPTVFEPKGLARSLTSRLMSPKEDKMPLPSFPSLTCHRDLFGWFYLAELYSACSLTRETDKLVAISGLAQIFGTAPASLTENQADVVEYLRTLALPRTRGAISGFGLDGRHASRPSGDYLAGLWKYDIIPCLLWHVANGRQVNGNPSQRIPDEPRAPSWSWASINGLLNASIYQTWGASTDGVHLAEPSYAATAPLYPELPWGQVSDGEIRLVGKLIHEKDIQWPSADEIEAGKLAISLHASEVRPKMVRRFTRNSASVARHRVLKAEVQCYMDDMKEFSAKLRRSGPSFEIGLLPLVGLQRRRPAWDSPTGYTDETYQHHGLVVVSKAVDDMVLAERLGYFCAHDTEVFGAVLNREGDKEIVLV